jgi:hypothetical protein
MLDMRDGLSKKLPNMVIVEVIDDTPALAVTHDQTEVAKQSKLMGDRGRLHPDGLGQLAH